jgi:hypothetical protein
MGPERQIADSNGEVTVNGDVMAGDPNVPAVKTGNGTVTVSGNVNGNVLTSKGEVTAGDIKGNMVTGNGAVSCDKAKVKAIAKHQNP